MDTRYVNFVARRTRHRVAAGASIEVSLQRASGESSRVTLLDLSREGARFRSAVELTRREPVALRIRHPESGLNLAFSAVVRWTEHEAADAWQVGCRMDRALPMESLGELFLNNVLEC